MKQSELVDQIVEKTQGDVPRKLVREIVQATLDIITNSIETQTPISTSAISSTPFVNEAGRKMARFRVTRQS